MPHILEEIVSHKRDEVARQRAKCPAVELQRQLAAAPPVRDFAAALAPPPSPLAGGAWPGNSEALPRPSAEQHQAAGPIRLIAEVKKASPSAGVIRADFDPVAIAQAYQRHGAAAISVLTDERFFQGSIDHLRAVRAAVALPVLRKDFIVDPYQVLEARTAGADAVLLIAEILDDAGLRRLLDLTRSLGMEALVELYEPENLERVLAAGARLVGINNRDLRTFQTDLEHTLRIRDRIPRGCILVSESGIRSRADVQRLQSAGVQAILVGETLMRSPSVGYAVDRLLGR